MVVSLVVCANLIFRCIRLWSGWCHFQKLLKRISFVGHFEIIVRTCWSNGTEKNGNKNQDSSPRLFASYSPQYSSSANICGGNGCLGSWSLAVHPLLVDFSCMNSFSASLPGSAMSITSYLMFLLSKIMRTRCWRFFTCNRAKFTRRVRLGYFWTCFFLSFSFILCLSHSKSIEKLHWHLRRTVFKYKQTNRNALVLMWANCSRIEGEERRYRDRQ